MLVVTVFDRSSISNVLCRAVFVVGSPGTNKTLQEELDDEKERHEDVIQTDFLDTYRHVCVCGGGGCCWYIAGIMSFLRLVLRSSTCHTYLIFIKLCG